MEQKTISDRLKKTRSSRNLTQAQLARKAGISQSTIGNIEAGIRDYGKSLLKIAKALDVSIKYLTLETDDPAISNEEAKALSPREAALLGLFGSLTDKQQDEIIRNLEITKRENSELLEDLLRKREAS